jgi:hypothetical protein
MGKRLFDKGTISASYWTLAFLKVAKLFGNGTQIQATAGCT